MNFKHNFKNIYLGVFDDEEEAGRAHDRMAVWFDLHGVVMNKHGGGGVHDSSSFKHSLNLAYNEYEGEFDELGRMSQEECVQKLQQQGRGKRKRERPESAADTPSALVGGGGGSGGDVGGGGGSGDGGMGGGDGGTAAGEVARQERTYTSQYRGVCWNRNDRRWYVNFTHNRKKIYLGYFNEEEEAGRAHDRMAVWLDLHGIVRNTHGGGGVHDSSSVKDSLNFAYDEYEGEFGELRRMTQDEVVQKLRPQDGNKRKRPESAADTHLALVGDRGGGGRGGDGVNAAGEVARQERTPTSQFRGVRWKPDSRRWHVALKHNHKNIYLGAFDEEQDAGRAYDRMAVWFDLHGIVRNKHGGSGVRDLSSVKDSLNFAYDGYRGEFVELRRMTQEECVQKLTRQGGKTRKRKRPESAADTHLALGGDGGGGGGDGGGGGSGGRKRNRVRSKSAADMHLALVGGGGGGGGGGNGDGGGGGSVGDGVGGDGGGGSGGDGVAAARARASVADARAEAADAGRHYAEMQLNAGLSNPCLPRHSPQFGPPLLELNGVLRHGEVMSRMYLLSLTQSTNAGLSSQCLPHHLPQSVVTGTVVTE